MAAELSPLAQASFNLQFAHMSKFRPPSGGVIKHRTMIPMDPTPNRLLFGPGWSENEEVMRVPTLEFFEAGRPVSVLTFLGRAHRRVRKDERVQDELVQEQPTILLNEALGILDYMDDQNIDQADVVTHSMRSLPVILAAYMEPTRFRNLVFVNPALEIEGDTFFTGLLPRFLKKVKEEYDKKKNDTDRKKIFNTQFWEGFKFSNLHQAQALQEATAITGATLLELFRRLHEVSGGEMHIGIMAGVDDPVFTMDALQTAVNAGDIDGFLSVQGGHDEIIYDPRHARAAEALVTSLEQKDTVGLWNSLKKLSRNSRYHNPHNQEYISIYDIGQERVFISSHNSPDGNLIMGSVIVRDDSRLDAAYGYEVREMTDGALQVERIDLSGNIIGDVYDNLEYPAIPDIVAVAKDEILESLLIERLRSMQERGRITLDDLPPVPPIDLPSRHELVLINDLLKSLTDTHLRHP